MASLLFVSLVLLVTAFCWFSVGVASQEGQSCSSSDPGSCTSSQQQLREEGSNEQHVEADTNKYSSEANEEDPLDAEMRKLFNTEIYPFFAAGAQDIFLDSIATQCQNSLNNQGLCVLPNFLTTDGIVALMKDIEGITPALSVKQHNIFQLPADPQLDSNHPRNRLLDAKMGFIGRKSYPDNSKHVKLYNWDVFFQFFSRAVNHTLYRSVDPEGSVYSTVNHEGYITAWHFDQHPFSAVFVLQPSDAGGEFEWLGHARSLDGAKVDYERIRQTLDRKPVFAYAYPPPGSLIILPGATSMHQVGMVQGERPRITTVFTYALEENFQNSAQVHNQNKWASADS